MPRRRNKNQELRIPSTNRYGAGRNHGTRKTKKEAEGIRTKFLTRRGAGLLLITAGCILFVGLGFYRGVYAQDLSFAVRETTVEVVPIVEEEKTVGVLPRQITIEKAGIDLPVFPGEIVRGKWTVDARGANHWRESAQLGEVGNVVIYGHNWRNLLGPIRELEVGDEIQVVGENQQKYKYTIKQTMKVKPTQVEIVLPTSEPQLTLYTCIGFMDRERFVIIAKPAS